MSHTFADLTTMRVGGPANKVLTANTPAELLEFLQSLASEDEDWMVLGGGSNTVMSDEGYPGTLLLVRTSGVEEIPDSEIDSSQVRLRVQAGEDWDKLVQETVARGFAGLEALSGIPGLAGAAPIQNIGAYGAELKDVLHSIEVFDTEELALRRIANAELGFGYRDSALKRREILGVVTSIDIVLQRATNDSQPEGKVLYAQLAKALDCEIGDERPIATIRKKVLELRASKGMVLDDADTDTWSSGSFFMNPVVSASFARTLPESAPSFPIEQSEEEPTIIPLDRIHEVDNLAPVEVKESRVKIPAAWLIENSGIQKGFALPGSRARISSKHTLALTNTGGASAAEIGELARFVIARVRSEFGIILVPEPNLYGISV